MTSREALNELFELAVFDNGCDLDKCKKCSVTLQKNCGSYQYYKTIEKDLEVLDFFKKLFVDIMPIRLTDLQDEKYLSIPNSDIRRPNALLPITEKEYELLKEWFRSNLLKEWLGK